MLYRASAINFVRFTFALLLLGVATPSSAVVDCTGKVAYVYKWHNMSALSMRIKLADGSITNWIGLPSKSDEAAALMALASGKTAWVYWSTSTITKCVDGWDHNKPLEGYFVVGE